MKLKFLFAFIILTAAVSFPQDAFEFLRLDMSARAGALAGSYTANNDDPDVIFYNPAGLNLLQGDMVSFSFFKHLLDINLASFSYSANLKDIGRIGAAIKYANYGSFTGADEFGAIQGDYGAGDLAVILGYSNKLDDNFNYGINGKFIYSSISDRSSSAIAVDLGLNYAVPAKGFFIGLAITNFGSQISKYYNTEEDLPVDISVGMAKKLEYLPLRFSVDFHKLNAKRDDFFQRFKAFSVGAEFTLSRVFKLRVGYDNERRSELKLGDFGGLAGFNGGLGITISQYRFDYGYSSLGSIGAFHRVSVSTNL